MPPELLNGVQEVIGESYRLYRTALEQPEDLKASSREKNRLACLHSQDALIHRLQTIPGGNDEYLGPRYALTCWVDSLFCDTDNDWKELWVEDILESRIYHRRSAANEFWRQMHTAYSRSLPADFQVYWLCVKLGFPLGEAAKEEVFRLWPVSAGSEPLLVEHLENHCNTAWRRETSAPQNPPPGVKLRRHLGHPDLVAK